MTDFSSFFPTAGGGGGFTKMNKYVTERSGNDATNKLPGPAVVEGVLTGAVSAGQTSFGWKLDNTPQPQIDRASTVNGLVGYTFDIGLGQQTVTANTGGGFLAGQTVSFTPALTGGASSGATCDFQSPTFFTVNPATDLGLEDGASIGYMLVGAGYSHVNYGGKGGKIIYGTAIITNASTNLVLTPGVANGANSTITGGLTLSSGDGSNMAGPADYRSSNAYGSGSGIMGYGAGGGNDRTDVRNVGGNFHGWGGGAYAGLTAGDGAILLYY